MHRVRSTAAGVVALAAIVAVASLLLASSNGFGNLSRVGYAYGYGCDGPYQYQYQYQYECGPSPYQGPDTPTPPGPGPTPPPTGTDPAPTNPAPPTTSQPTATDPAPPTTTREPTGATPPRAPAPGTIRVLGGATSSRYALVAANGLRFSFPLREAGVRVRAQLSIRDTVARKLGLKVPRGSRIVVIGSSTSTQARAGSAVIKVPLTAAARTALRRATAKRLKLPTIAATLTLDLSKGGASSTAKKPVPLRR